MGLDGKWKKERKKEIMNNKSFSQLIKKSNTDEWYTPQYAVNLIIPYLFKRGYKKSCVHSIKKKVIL